MRPAVALPVLSRTEYELLIYAVGLAQGLMSKEQMFDSLEALLRLSDKIMAQSRTAEASMEPR